jgi:hypothetical protein
MTLMLPPPAVRGTNPPIDPILPPDPKKRVPGLWLSMSPDREDIRLDIDDRLNELRAEPIAEGPRAGKERLAPPPVRYGMKPPKLPAYGMMRLLLPPPANEPLEAAL